MPSLLPKAKKATSWLPNQVAYGIDCSDPEPANWKPFGYQVDQAQEAAKHSARARDAKIDPQEQ